MKFLMYLFYTVGPIRIWMKNILNTVILQHLILQTYGLP